MDKETFGNMSRYYDLSVKLKAVNLYNRGKSSTVISRLLQVSPSQVVRWYNLYEKYGEEGLTNKNRWVSYEEKCKIVHEVLYKGLSCEQVALLRRYGKSSVARWVLQVRESGNYNILKRKDARKQDSERSPIGVENPEERGSLSPCGKRSIKKNHKNIRGEKEKAINEFRKDHKLSLMLRIEGIPRSSYYYRLSHSKKERYEIERKRILSIYEASNRTYGYRRITMAMHSEGYDINHKTVSRLMKELDIQALQKRRRYNSYKGTVGKTAENIISRDFNADRPNTKLSTDISQINIGETKLYLSAMIDMFNGEVISHTISESPNMNLVMAMMKKADRRDAFGNGCIVHSDQGWQYQHFLFQSFLKTRKITQSMSRKGNCYDNAMMESFFGSMKSELLYLHTFKDKNDFISALNNYIKYYNNKRIKLRLKNSPVNYRIQLQ